MSAWGSFFLVALALAIGFLGYRSIRSFRLFLRFRGERLVTCPETQKPAAVQVAAGQVATHALVDGWHLRLNECSRWPEHQDCGQHCLSQIEAAPEDCLVWTIVSRWYTGKTCVYCGKPFGQIRWLDRRPALLGPDLRTVQWDAVPAEKLPEVLSTYSPVCWSCHIAQAFRGEHPDLVVERPWKRGPTGAIVCNGDKEHQGHSHG